MPESKFDINKAAGNAPMLAAEFIKQSPPIIISGDDLYVWNSKFYDRLTAAMSHKLIMKFFQDNGIYPHWKHAKAEEMIKAIKYSPNIKEVPVMDDYDNLMNFNNVIINLDTNETTPHSPDLFFSYALEVDYNADKTEHPNFSGLLKQLFHTGPKPDDYDQDTVRLLLYIMAYLIYPQIKIEQMFIFLGAGANGKSVLIEIIKSFFPSKYVTSLSLGTISNKESFSRNSLFWSRLNIATEDRVGQKVESEEIKKVVSGEQISMRKLYNEPVELKPRTKFLLALNDFLYLNDTSDGANRRLCIIEFKNKFVSADKYAQEINPEGRRIYKSRLKNEILAEIEEEKPAIFNTLLVYLKSLKTLDWVLPETKNTQETIAEYKAGTDTLGTWLTDTYMLADYSDTDPRAISINDILNDFKSYYEINFPGKRFGYSVAAVGRKIKQIFRIDSDRRYRNVIGYGGKVTQLRTRVYNLKKIDEQESAPSDDKIEVQFQTPTQPTLDYNDDDIDLNNVDF